MAFSGSPGLWLHLLAAPHAPHVPNMSMRGMFPSPALAAGAKTLLRLCCISTFAPRDAAHQQEPNDADLSCDLTVASTSRLGAAAPASAYELCRSTMLGSARIEAPRSFQTHDRTLLRLITNIQERPREEASVTLLISPTQLWCSKTSIQSTLSAILPGTPPLTRPLFSPSLSPPHAPSSPVPLPAAYPRSRRVTPAPDPQSPVELL